MRRGLFTVAVCSFLLNTCAPVNTPKPPARRLAVVNYDPQIGQLVIPKRYDGGVLLCVEDAMQLQASCIRLLDLRRALAGLENADSGAGGPDLKGKP